MSLVISGRVWKLGDGVNTDAFYPGHQLGKPVEEASTWVLESLRPGFSEQVQPGDIIVGGRDFGIGSGRPAARLLRHLKVGAVVAEDFSSLFFRNCINLGFPALTVQNVTKMVDDGDPATLDMNAGTITNVRTGEVAQGERLPESLIELVEAGGILPRLRAQGFLPPLEESATS